VELVHALHDFLSPSWCGILALCYFSAEESQELGNTGNGVSIKEKGCVGRSDVRAPLEVAIAASVFRGHKLMCWLLGILEDANVVKLHHFGYTMVRGKR
jgi:hypothetical protein